MEEREIESSMIRRLGYDYGAEIMLVVFENEGARTYYYHPVELDLFERLVNAESAGATFNEEVRGNPTIEHVRVGRDVEDEEEAYEYFLDNR